ncbi:thioesterase family protein [Aquabacterium sp.]|uniref:acyl-CoA thioesterase n=1 Tax=Aquabacterium sp. TaxID=1872578 RepID=UPI0019C35C82|nr:thioesterase family protein [Aquabacterium sp.]MBC7701999.1 acyl-CoA thioesterase [Aquabacterium sp.]
MRLDIPEQKILVHDVTLSVYWGDMDALGHVNNAVYFRYMEQVRVSWIASMSGPVTQGVEGPVIANTFCNFYRELEFPAQVIAKLYVANPGRTSFDTFVTIERADQLGEICAAGGATLVWVSSAERRPIPLPPFLRAIVGPAPALPGVEVPPALPM